MLKIVNFSYSIFSDFSQVKYDDTEYQRPYASSQKTSILREFFIVSEAQFPIL